MTLALMVLDFDLAHVRLAEALGVDSEDIVSELRDFIASVSEDSEAN